MEEDKLRLQIIAVCRRMAAAGYVFGTWGNVSVRLQDGSILMTPSKVGYDEMTPQDLVKMAPDGKKLSGKRLPTSEREIHRGIMNARADVQAIIHTHSPFALAASVLGREIPALTEEMCQLLGGAIPTTHAFVPSEDHAALGAMATESIGEHNALLLRNHGIVCCGRSLEEAEVCSQVAEKSAQIYLQLLASGQSIEPLKEPYVSMGRRYFLEGYGRT